MTNSKIRSILPKQFRQYSDEEALPLLVQDYEQQEKMTRWQDEKIEELNNQIDLLKTENEQLRAEIHAQKVITHFKVAMAIRDF